MSRHSSTPASSAQWRNQVQVFLPVPQSESAREGHRQVREELISAFGGLTAYTRVPATGYWSKDDAPGGAVVRDEIVVYEVVCDTLDSAWWQVYRQALEKRFAQRSVLIVAQPARTL